MYDQALALEILQRLHQTTETILTRFAPVKSAQDFTGSPTGMEKLDSICMLLIAIGGGLKNLGKVTAGALLASYPQIDWKRAKGLRDLITHQYFNVDAEEIFYICATHLELMRNVLRQIIEELS